MCVIVYKQKGFPLPSKSMLLKCWTANPDGAGFAYNDGKKVYFEKGFATFKSFYNTLLEVDSAINLQNKDLILHFRIATSGGITAAKTHPFEITASLRKMERLKGTCKRAFFHNGIINEFASAKHSDSENFNKLILANIKNLEQQAPLIDYLARVNNSRFAIITKNNVILGGDFLSDNNMLVSNKNYTYYYNEYYNKYDKTKYISNTYDKRQYYIYSDYNYKFD